MLCPWCGAPVMVRGTQWECGWCGDFGIYTPPPQVPVTITVSIIWDNDLGERWDNMKNLLHTLSPRHYAQLLPGLGKALMYQVSHSISTAKVPPMPERLQALKAFINKTPELNVPSDTYSRVSRGEPVFDAESILTEEECGKFWQSLLAAWDEEGIKFEYPEAAADFFREIAEVYAWYNDKETNCACFYEDDLNLALCAHWRKLNPQAE